ncbi:MAG: fimbria/pilus periplasmic chaperone [Gemmatimonadaceae bacterium]
MRATALALCAIGLVAARPLAAQLLVDPLEVAITASGTSRVTASFSLANTSDAPVQATITREDWDRAENGDNRFMPAGTTGTSCGKLLTASPVAVRIEPHTARIVRLAVEGAAALRKECWDIFFVEEVPRRTGVRGNSLQYIFRTGVKVYVAPPGLRRDAAVEDMAVEDVPLTPVAASASSTPAVTPVNAPVPTKRQISIRFHNTGEAHLVAKGRLEFRRLDNSLATQVPIPEFPTLPGSVRKVLIDVPAGMAAGDYVVLALIDFGGAELVAGQIELQAK